MLGAIDFTTIEVWTKGGLVTYYLLFVMKVATRSVHFAGCTVNPTAEWMTQVARNLTDAYDGFLTGVRYLLMDRDDKFCQDFRDLLEHEGVEPVRLPPRSPNRPLMYPKTRRASKVTITETIRAEWIDRRKK